MVSKILEIKTVEVRKINMMIGKPQSVKTSCKGRKETFVIIGTVVSLPAVAIGNRMLNIFKSQPGHISVQLHQSC